MSNEIGYTGKFRYRSGLGGKLILQVEVTYQRSQCEGMDFTHYTLWRDATVSDLNVIDAVPRVYGGQ
ncbi:hypothetical protein D3C80_1121600 [compost metagenome]